MLLLITECSRRKFGQNCRERCSENCKNSGVCDHIDGHCDCEEGYKGDTCIEGKYSGVCVTTLMGTVTVGKGTRGTPV